LKICDITIRIIPELFLRLCRKKEDKMIISIADSFMFRFVFFNNDMGIGTTGSKGTERSAP